ncbi:MAG: terminase small subunit [Pyrinomonadaceae bacterium]
MAKNDKTKYKLFAAYYVGEANFNATRAAELAGFKASTKGSLQTQASAAMQMPEVQEYIREHVRATQITQEELLREMSDLARWNWRDQVEEVATMEQAKVFDTMMRGKVKALSDLMKLHSSDLAKEMAKVRKAIEQHREQFPDMSDAERADVFKAYIDPKMVEQVMRELLAEVENRKRLAEAEAEVADPFGTTEVGTVQ